MRLLWSLQQNLLYKIVGFSLLLNGSCKSRTVAWHNILDKQMNQDRQLNQLDSDLYRFIVDYHLPAISITVAKGEKIIYSKAYGLANLSTREEVHKESLFQIGGLSTAITSLAVRKLVGMGQLSYDSKVFGEGSILGTQYGHIPYNAFLKEITIADLLKHTCGGWSETDDIMSDPGIRSRFASKDSALSWILDQYPIKRKPGSDFNFSFTGYFILGIIIEKITGISYEQWVRENILKPAGITDMEVEKDNSPNAKEVRFYKDDNWPLYNGDIDFKQNLSIADAAIGWIACSGDLIKLFLKFKNSDSLDPRLKSLDSLPILIPPKNKPDLATDWTIRKPSDNWWEQFHIYGSSSIIVQFSSGFCWAMLINTQRPSMEDYFTDIDSLINKTVADTNIRWAMDQSH